MPEPLQFACNSWCPSAESTRVWFTMAKVCTPNFLVFFFLRGAKFYTRGAVEQAEMNIWARTVDVGQMPRTVANGLS
jgi:hypothetical protein